MIAHKPTFCKTQYLCDIAVSLFVDIISISCENVEAAQAGVGVEAAAWATGPVCCMQAKQREQEEFVRRAERIRKLEARQKQEEEAALKALSQQLLAHQVCAHPVQIWNRSTCNTLVSLK